MTGFPGVMTFALFFVYGLFCWVREKVMRLFGKNEN